MAAMSNRFSGGRTAPDLRRCQCFRQIAGAYVNARTRFGFEWGAMLCSIAACVVRSSFAGEMEMTEPEFESVALWVVVVAVLVLMTPWALL